MEGRWGRSKKVRGEGKGSTMGLEMHMVEEQT